MPPTPRKRARIVDSEDLAEERQGRASTAEHEDATVRDVGDASGAQAGVEGDVDQQAAAGGELEEDPALAERRRIWDDFQDEYFDVVDRLPLELQRNAELMLEHDRQARKHERDLQAALLRYTKAVRAAETAEEPQDTSKSHQSATKNVSQSNRRDSGHEEHSITSEDDVRNSLLPTLPPASYYASHSSSQPVADTPLEAMLREIATLTKAAVRACEDKVALATIAYDTVDRHIQRLDGDLLKHEEALSLGLRAGTMPSTDAQEAQTQALIDAQLQNGQQPGTTAAGGKGDLAPPAQPAQGERSPSREPPKRSLKKGAAGGEKKKGKKGVTVGHPVDPLPTLPAGFAPQPLDLKYCYCQQVSYGPMVGCDNEDCEREWFHLACVGLTSEPAKSEKFYCADCAKLLGIEG